MVKGWLVLISLSLSVALCSSCSKGCGFLKENDSGFSGYGYLEGFSNAGARAEFVIESEKDEVDTVLIRGKCEFSNDLETCILKSEFFTAPVIFKEYGVWTDAKVGIVLKKGLNHIELVRAIRTGGEISIDYIEIQ
jgi:hypothetical protein